MSNVLLIAALATQAVSADEAAIGARNRAGDRLAPLVPRSAGHGKRCTQDRRWCVLLIEPENGSPPLPTVRAGDATGPAPRPPAEERPSDESYAVWPFLLALRDGSFLAGVEARTSTGYSGGGGSAANLRLFHVSSDGKADAKPVFDALLDGSLVIRACFSEKEARRRRGACHDEYGFSARIGLAPGSAAERPILTYVTEAWAFPRGVSRFRDSSQMGPLRQDDLVRQPNAACSFARWFRFDAVARAYWPDRPLPDCLNYTMP